jgi:hypothetical protein
MSSNEYKMAGGGQFDILHPSGSDGRRAYVDFVFGLEYLSVNSKLLRMMHAAMSAYGLSCLLVNGSNVERSIEAVKKGRLRPLVYLDLCGLPGDIFASMLRTVSEHGVYGLCDPKNIGWTYKAVSHPALERAGLPLPPTVMLKQTDADRDLTSEESARLGERCVIKPSYGVAGLGAVIGVAPTKNEIAKAREYNRKDDWLIQKMIRWGMCGERQAYLRGYNILGHRTLMWWNNEQGYWPLTWDDLRRYDLLPAVELIDRVAAVTGVEFFSTEIAITAEVGRPGAERYCLIDYVNDQCDIDPQAHPGRSPPEAWIRWICERLAEFTWRKKHGLPGDGEGSLYLTDTD